jgi:hypothetical protein
MQRLRVFLPYFLVALALLIIAPLAYKHFNNAIPKKKEPVVLQGGDIGQRIAQFIEGAQRPDGSFYVAYECTVRGIPCTPLENPQVSYAGLAIVALSLAGHKESADKAVQFSLSRCKSDSTCDFIAFDSYYRETEDARYRAALEVAGKDALAQTVSAKTAEQYAVLARKNIPEKLARMYEITGDIRYHNALDTMGENILEQIDFASGKEMMASGKYEEYSSMAILASKTLIYAYQATEDAKYKDAVKSFFDASDIARNAFGLLSPPHYLNEAVIASAEGLSYYAVMESDPAAAVRYKDDARLILQTILAAGFDAVERPLWDGGNNLLVRSSATPTRQDNQDIRYKATNENGRTARLLLTYYKDTPFELTL